MNFEEIDLGDKYTDSITGFSGIATAKCAYLGDGPQVKLDPERSCELDYKRGGQWFPIMRLVPFGFIPTGTE